MTFDDYEQIRRVGHGAEGTVFLVRHRVTMEDFVIKKIFLRNRRLACLSEARILKSLRHPHIIRYHDSFTDPSSEHLCIVTDYCEGGNLDDRIRAQRRSGSCFPESLIMDWFVQIVLAMRYVHSQKILHRDLKSANIFLTKQDRIKVGDFGIAAVLEHSLDMKRTCVGSPYYMSPEVCQDRPYNSKSDVWALGCVLYELCALRQAFKGNNLLSVVNKICGGSYEPLSQVSYSSQLRGLVDLLLQTEPEARPSIPDIVVNPYFKECLASFIARNEELVRLAVLSRQATPIGSSRAAAGVIAVGSVGTAASVSAVSRAAAAAAALASGRRRQSGGNGGGSSSSSSGGDPHTRRTLDRRRSKPSGEVHRGTVRTGRRRQSSDSEEPELVIMGNSTGSASDAPRQPHSRILRPLVRVRRPSSPGRSSDITTAAAAHAGAAANPSMLLINAPRTRRDRSISPGGRNSPGGGRGRSNSGGSGGGSGGGGGSPRSSMYRSPSSGSLKGLEAATLPAIKQTETAHTEGSMAADPPSTGTLVTGAGGATASSNTVGTKNSRNNSSSNSNSSSSSSSSNNNISSSNNSSSNSSNSSSSSTAAAAAAGAASTISTTPTKKKKKARPLPSYMQPTKASASRSPNVSPRSSSSSRRTSNLDRDGRRRAGSLEKQRRSGGGGRGRAVPLSPVRPRHFDKDSLSSSPSASSALQHTSSSIPPDAVIGAVDAVAKKTTTTFSKATKATSSPSQSSSPPSLLSVPPLPSALSLSPPLPKATSLSAIRSSSLSPSSSLSSLLSVPKAKAPAGGFTDSASGHVSPAPPHEPEGVRAHGMLSSPPPPVIISTNTSSSVSGPRVVVAPARLDSPPMSEDSLDGDFVPESIDLLVDASKGTELELEEEEQEEQERERERISNGFGESEEELEEEANAIAEVGDPFDPLELPAADPQELFHSDSISSTAEEEELIAAMSLAREALQSRAEDYPDDHLFGDKDTESNPPPRLFLRSHCLDTLGEKVFESVYAYFHTGGGRDTYRRFSSTSSERGSVGGSATSNSMTDSTTSGDPEPPELPSEQQEKLLEIVGDSANLRFCLLVAELVDMETHRPLSRVASSHDKVL